MADAKKTVEPMVVPENVTEALIDEDGKFIGWRGNTGSSEFTVVNGVTMDGPCPRGFHPCVTKGCCQD